MDTIVRTPQQIGSALRRYRRSANLTQGALGERMSGRQATVSKLEAGEPATQLRVLTDALAALDLELVIRPRTRGTTDSLDELF
jgi:HTH-type transcriptional regulator / antitoxin HipB